MTMIMIMMMIVIIIITTTSSHHHIMIIITLKFATPLHDMLIGVTTSTLSS